MMLLQTTDLVARAHAQGLQVHVWTFRNEYQYLAWEFNQDPYQELEKFDNLGKTCLKHVTEEKPSLPIPIFVSFMQFLGKCGRIIGWRCPPFWDRCPLCEILDPSLRSISQSSRAVKPYFLPEMKNRKGAQIPDARLEPLFFLCQSSFYLLFRKTQKMCNYWEDIICFFLLWINSDIFRVSGIDGFITDFPATTSRFVRWRYNNECTCTQSKQTSRTTSHHFSPWLLLTCFLFLWLLMRLRNKL